MLGSVGEEGGPPWALPERPRWPVIARFTAAVVIFGLLLPLAATAYATTPLFAKPNGSQFQASVSASGARVFFVSSATNTPLYRARADHGRPSRFAPFGFWFDVRRNRFHLLANPSGFGQNLLIGRINDAGSLVYGIAGGGGDTAEAGAFAYRLDQGRFLPDMRALVGSVPGVNGVSNPGTLADGATVLALGPDDKLLLAIPNQRSPVALGPLYLVDTPRQAATLVATGIEYEPRVGASFTSVALDPTGARVAFSSAAQQAGSMLVDGLSHTYLRELPGGSLSALDRASGADGATADRDSYLKAASADLARVVFSSAASNLDPRADGRRHLYVRDLPSAQTTAVDVSGTQPGLAAGDVAGADLSADGRYAVFDSTASDLVRGDRCHGADVFIADLQTHRIRALTGRRVTRRRCDSSDPQISADGRTVTFTSFAGGLKDRSGRPIVRVFIAANPFTR